MYGCRKGERLTMPVLLMSTRSTTGRWSDAMHELRRADGTGCDGEWPRAANDAHGLGGDVRLQLDGE
jgi:hypothetical protein